METLIDLLFRRKYSPFFWMAYTLFFAFRMGQSWSQVDYETFGFSLFAIVCGLGAIHQTHLFRKEQ